MSTIETSEISCQLYEARAFLGSIFVRCQASRSLAVACAVQEAQGKVNAAISTLEGSPDFQAVKAVGVAVLNTNLEAVRP